MSVAVVFVCNFRYLDKFIATCGNLIEIGDYHGPIVLVVGDDLPAVDTHPFIVEHAHQIQVRHYPDIVFSSETFAAIQKTNAACGKSGFKLFQYHKFHIFTPFFRQWDYIFYVDCGAKIYAPIAPILESKKPSKLVAHSDAYPSYQWRLKDQFTDTISIDQWNGSADYFQSTIMLFHSALIRDTTFDDLVKLATKYTNSCTNDQGILNLYFADSWEQISLGDMETYYYDFNIRAQDRPYIMTKYVVFND
jgi:hypothetical protein